MFFFSVLNFFLQLIVGLTVGIIAILALIIIAVALYIFKNRKHGKDPYTGTFYFLFFYFFQ